MTLRDRVLNSYALLAYLKNKSQYRELLSCDAQLDDVVLVHHSITLGVFSTQSRLHAAARRQSE